MRPLLYALGVAGTAAALYFFLKQRGEAHTTHPENPVRTNSVDPGWMPSVNGGSVAHTDSTISEADTQRMYEQVVKTKTQLEKQNSSLMAKVNRLQEELSLTRIWLKDVMRMREQEQDTLAKTKWNFKEAMVSIAQLEKETSDLVSQVEQLTKELAETHSKYIDIRTTLAEFEKEHQALLTTSEELVIEKFDLNHKLCMLQDSLQEAEEQLSETRCRHDELMMVLEKQNVERRENPVGQ